MVALLAADSSTDLDNVLNTVESKQFYIFGYNISHSLSPKIHNTAFKHHGLPHHYSIHQTLEIDRRVRDILASDEFGGASVTSPHKVAIQPLLDGVSESVRKLGAVNTIVVRNIKSGARTLYGDNTDWVGIMNCIRRGGVDHADTGLVIGAGGAARAAVFALVQLGVSNVIIVNRGRERVEQLVADFTENQNSKDGSRQTTTFHLLSSITEVDPKTDIRIIVGCVPADDIGDSDIPLHLFDMQDGDGAKGVVVEMSYRPKVSALMRVASRFRSSPQWSVFGGVDVLMEQAYGQYQLWTGRQAPVAAIERALMQ